MPLVSSSIPNLVNGVSQQPAALRLASQCEEQVNCLPSVIEGLRKRPPTEHLAKVADATDKIGASFIHTINRDASERYIVSIANRSIRVWDLDGNEQVVNISGNTDYLATSSPESDFKAVTVADYTFVVNSGVTPRMDPGSAVADGTTEVLLFVRQASYETDYNVQINSSTFSYTTGDDGKISTSEIAGHFAAEIDAAFSSITVERAGSVVSLRSSSDFSILVEDSQANTHISAFKGKTQRFSDLPTAGRRGFTLEITGDQSSNFDNYYVEFVPKNDDKDLDEGTWRETVKPGVLKSFDASTMPHGLVREASGTFTFGPLEWGSRSVGDEESAPDPSFVGRQINDLFFYKNRLGLLADENVILSRAGEFFEFFPRTVTTIVDSDPIDVSASHVKVSILRHAVPFNETLLLFSDQTQFVINDEDILASSPPTPEVLTEFESSLLAKPVGAGKTVFFATQKGQFSGVREYYIQADSQTNDAADITAHVPKYLPADIYKLAVAANEDVLFALSKRAPNRIYVYKYYWAGSEKLQSAWGFFEFPEDRHVLSVDFIGTDAFLLLETPDGNHIEKMPVEPGRVDEFAPFEYHIDRKITPSSVSYSAADKSTSISLPYASRSDRVVVVSKHKDPDQVQPGDIPPGVVFGATVDAATGLTVTVPGVDLTNTPIFVGERYRMRYRFSTQHIKEEALGGGQAVIGEGRLQFRFWSIIFDETGFFETIVKPRGKRTSIRRFTGRVLGSPNSVLGDVPIESGTFKFPVMAKNDQVEVEIHNDTHLPSRLLSAEWEGLYSIRSRRL